MNRQWISTTLAARCPVCGKAGWCRLSADGELAACRRVEQGAARTRTDRNGAPVFIHRIGGAAVDPPRLDPPTASTATANRADADTRHRVYAALLANLTLSATHRAALRNRGLTGTQIDAAGYRTLPVQGRARIARQLAERFGDGELLTVPGFAVKSGADGSQYPTVTGAAGLLIPCRTASGQIAALKVRRDADGDGPRYSYLSSAKSGGASAELVCHVPVGIGKSAAIVRVTEGETKADVATALDRMATISIPGVANWKTCLPVLHELQTKQVLIAFDADSREKPAVSRALQAAFDGLLGEGFAVAIERWDAERGKGIDDLLASGHKPDTLTGKLAEDYIASCLASAGAERAPSPLDRLAAALDGGAEKLFADSVLLDALGQLAESNPAEWQCIRARVKAAKIPLRGLDNAIAPIRQRIRAAAPPLQAAGEYRIVGGCTVRQLQTRDGPIDCQLANFSARIVEQTTADDGAERALYLALEGTLRDGTPLPRVEIPAKDFADLQWVVPSWGTRAVIAAGPGARDHLRAAIQSLSGDAPTRTVYGHTGWKNIGGGWVYLHGAGGIGASGAVDGIETRLPDSLSRFALPSPPDGDELRRAVRASLAILNVAPPRIAWPLLAAVFRAPLGACDCSLFLCGPTGVGKSELSALAQQHYGPAMTREHLPGGWSSTANSLESLAFILKDCLLTVDDFAPGGGANDVLKLHREADRLLRAAGNGAGRGRMRRDGSLQPARPPRGLILASGEDMPRGQSLAARLLSVAVKSGDVHFHELTGCQRDAADGLYAGSMAAFVRWLAGRYEGIVAGLAAERAALRALAGLASSHKRTPGAVADFGIGVRCFLRFAADVGAIDEPENARHWREAWDALRAAGAEQERHIAASDPVSRFLALLGSSIASGAAHVAGSDGDKPATAQAWGWRTEPGRNGPEWRPLGRRVGWSDGINLYLDPGASFAVAQTLGAQTGEPLPVSERTIRMRLHEGKILASTDPARETLAVRRTLDGVQRSVLHLLASAVFRADVGSTRHFVGSENADPTSENATIPSENVENVGFVGSPAMEIVGGENNNCGDAFEPPHDGPLDADALNFPFGANGV